MTCCLFFINQQRRTFNYNQAHFVACCLFASLFTWNIERNLLTLDKNYNHSSLSAMSSNNFHLGYINGLAWIKDFPANMSI